MPNKQLKETISKITGRSVLYSEDIQDSRLWGTVLFQAREILKKRGIETKVYDYLYQQGMLVKLEQDMRVATPAARDNFVDFADYLKELFICYPILGMARFSEEDSRRLFHLGQNTFQKLDGSARLSPQEEDALIMATIQLLKKWRPDEEDDNSMWLYIYKQFGYKEHEESGSQRIYERYRQIIRSVMRRYNRFFAPKGTQRYYTTLMLHSLAPKHGFCNLFEILIRFFEKNLKFQYLPEDPSYSVFVERIKTRWGIPSELEKLGLYSAAMHSGLKTLFLNRTDFMAFFCDNIVMKINALLQTGSIEAGDFQDSYLDEMLQEWYLEKSLHVRARWTHKQRSQAGERTIASAKDTNPVYMLHNNRISIFIPNIRLSAVSGDRPKARLYQGERLVNEYKLDVFGDDLSWTIRKAHFRLDQVSVDFSKGFHLRMELVYQGETIFNSHERLFRPYMFFGSNGAEARPESLSHGLAYLFTGEETQLVSLGLEDAVLLDHPGQLLEVHAETIQDLRLDGLEIFLPAQDKDSVRVYPSRASFSGAHAQKEGHLYQVYDRPFQFSIHLSQDESPLSYLVQTGSSIQPLHRLMENGQSACLVESAVSGVFSELIIKDFITSSVIYSFRYVVLEGFDVKYSEPFFISNQAVVQGNYHYLGDEHIFSVPLQGEEEIRLVSADGLIELLLTPPLLRCELLGKELFSQNLVFWYKDISREVFLRPSIPPGWLASAHLGNQTLATFDGREDVDLGNVLSAYAASAKTETLWFSLTHAHHARQDIPACTIYFHPSFRQAPLQLEDGRLLWQVQDNFIGDRKSAFNITLMHRRNEFANYRLLNQNEVVEKAFPVQVGVFHYEVFLSEQSLFGEKCASIYQGEFTIGDENELRFDGWNVHLHTAVNWDLQKKRTENLAVRENAARISDIRYIGMSIPSGEEQAFPEYEGTLSFYDERDDHWQPFNGDEGKEEYELINPVRLWVINDDMMIVYTCTEDALYFDKSRNWFMNKDPAIEMRRELLKAISAFPDYYAYRKGET